MHGFLLSIAMLTMHLALYQGTAQPKPATEKPVAEIIALEEHLANEFNAARKSAGQKPLAFRKDIRVRMEACSVAQNGKDDLVEPPRRPKLWYVTLDPQVLSPNLKELAASEVKYSSVGVGVWYAVSEQYPAGAYWVVIYPEHSAAHEAFWSHFYLTDTFEYQTRFDKYWKKRLPPQCRDLK